MTPCLGGKSSKDERHSRATTSFANRLYHDMRSEDRPLKIKNAVGDMQDIE